jgi:hypothetical protein
MFCAHKPLLAFTVVRLILSNCHYDIMGTKGLIVVALNSFVLNNNQWNSYRIEIPRRAEPLFCHGNENR